MEPEGSLTHSQAPATCSYPQPARSSPYPQIPFPEDPFYYYPPLYSWVSKMVPFSQVSPPKPCIRLSSTHTCYMPRPSHSSPFYHPKTFGVQYRSLSSSLCSFLHSPVSSSLLGPNILLSTIFSKTLSLRSFLNLSEQVSNPCKTTGKIKALYMF